MEQHLNIYEKLAKIGEPIQILKKTKKGYNYTYVPEEEILAGIQNGMRQYKVSLIPHIVPNSTKTQMVTTEKTRAAKDGRIYTEYVNEYLVTGEMTFSWVNTENPDERVEVPWYFSGQQPDSSQAYGSALTYASRYFKLQFFQVATTDDPDALIAKKKEREAQENKAVLTEIFSQTAKVIDDYLKSFKDGSKEHTAARQTLLDTCKKFAGSTDYRKITDPKNAAELLAEINKITGKESK